MKKILLNQLPEIILFENFLTNDECKNIINQANNFSNNFDSASFFNFEGVKKVNLDANSSSTLPLHNYLPDLVNDLKIKYANLLNLNVRTIHNPLLNKYEEGQHFGLHYDYLTLKKEEYFTDQLTPMGNRISTFTLYLNDEYEGGELFFPYMNLKIKPKKGSLLFWRYNYDDPNLNIQTLHEVKKIDKGTKFSITNLVFEFEQRNKSNTFKKFNDEALIIANTKQVEYNYSNLKFKLPRCNKPTDTIIIDFKLDVQSLVNTYLIGVLNHKSVIPYRIIPIYCGMSPNYANMFFNKLPLSKLKNVADLVCIEEHHSLKDFLNEDNEYSKYWDYKILISDKDTDLNLIIDKLFYNLSLNDVKEFASKLGLNYTHTTLNNSPIIKVFENFSNANEITQLKDLFNINKDKMKLGKIINGDDRIIETKHRNNLVLSLPKNDLVMDIKRRIAEITGHNIENIANPIFNLYSEDDYYEPHIDYIVNNENCIFPKGGNRVATAILYLNDEYEGGELYFNHLYLRVKPQAGSLVFFNYNGNLIDYKTLHEVKNIKRGFQYIAVFFIHEYSLKKETSNFIKHSEEFKFFKSSNEVKFSINCGPEWDIRPISINLPSNLNPDHAILVGFTGGIDSTLLLYLLCVLNHKQKVPFRIIPILIQSRIEDTPQLFDTYEPANSIVNKIKEKTKAYFLTSLKVYRPPKDRKTSSDIRAGLWGFFYKLADEKFPNRHRYWDPKYIFTGDYPRISIDWIQDEGLSPLKSWREEWKQPFFNLTKYHIFDLYIKLKLEDLLNYTRCETLHLSYDEKCIAYACNERRWGLMKLNRFDLIDKYFLRRTDNG